METWEYKKITMYMLCALLILNLLDAMLTVYGIGAGIFKEENPIVRQTLEEPKIFFLIKVIIVTLAIGQTMWSINRTTEINHKTMIGMTVVVFIMTMFYLAIVTWALSLILIPKLLTLLPYMGIGIALTAIVVVSWLLAAIALITR